MGNKTLIYIPYQDTDNFYSDGILTREFAMLYLLYNMGFEQVINIKKPRTFLDRKKYSVHEDFYPEGTVEHEVKKICDSAETYQYITGFSMDQVFNRRGWWKRGYHKLEKKISLHKVVNEHCLVYSDNPYAVTLLKILKESGCKIYFDIMDNFAIHPSLSKKEQNAALEGYREILSFADMVSANSVQTCDFMKNISGTPVALVKNGVFQRKNRDDLFIPGCVNLIKKKKEEYKKCVGYIGKLGKRLDAELIDEVTENCPDTLFVFVGGYLKGQANVKLEDIFLKKNVLHIDSVPSAYTYALLDEFDILSVPHAVGKAENGGDPLKLYQYMTTDKPIITTGILGVDEFKDSICIADKAYQWTDFISNDVGDSHTRDVKEFIWETRIAPIKRWVNTAMTKEES